MSWQDIMRRVLPPIGGVLPHITNAGAYGAGAEQGRKPPSSIPHRGVDFNYIGGKEARLNRSNPELRSPVAGIVTNAGEGSVGRIAIRDANGFSHEILHTQTQKVKRGDLVGVGQPIGTMGNIGTEDQHVHYQLKDTAGHPINPTKFWDQLGPAMTDPGEPAYLDEYQQYLRRSAANAGHGFGNAPGTANVPAPGLLDVPSVQSPPTYARQTAPRLGRRIAGKSQSLFDAGTPAVPFVPLNDVLARDRPESFDNRFGNWGFIPAGGFGNPGSVAPQKDKRSAAPDDLAPPPAPALQTDSIPERRLGRRTYSVSPTSVFDTGTPAAPFVSSGDADYSGGLLGMFAPAGADPQNPNQPALPDDEQEQADLQALEDTLSRSGNIRDAVTLYKARIVNRR